MNPEIQLFITENIGNDITKMALQKCPFPAVNWIEILNQIATKTKAQDKLPTFFATKNIVYPSKISVEQTSSEQTAKYKANIISGEILIDLTGGFGVDDLFFSKKFKTVVHCEINEELSAIAKHNFKQLQAINVDCMVGDSTKILAILNQKFDWIYIDPSRRNDAKGKVFMLKDCLPNVPENLNFYFKYANKILVKTSPLLDITAGLDELKNVKCIHIVAVDNEVKELLWEIEKNYSDNILINCINISKSNSNFVCSFNDNSYTPNFVLPKKYLFEPNAAIMKSGAFNQVAQQFGIDKLNPNSHLYTGNEIINFPGRVFVVIDCFKYHKTTMKTKLAGTKANITVRNFSERVADIKKKWNIKDGGNKYCFFTTDCNQQNIVIICDQIF